MFPRCDSSLLFFLLKIALYPLPGRFLKADERLHHTKTSACHSAGRWMGVRTRASLHKTHSDLQIVCYSRPRVLLLFQLELVLTGQLCGHAFMVVRKL